MNDQPSDNPTNESTPEALLPTAIDEALSQASGLAGDLLKEVGTAEAAPTPADTAPAALEDKSPPGEALDVQLSYIQQGLAVTRSELNGSSDEDASDTGSMDYRAAAEAFGAIVDDSAEDEGADSTADGPEPTSGESFGQAHSPESGKLPGGKVIKLARRSSPPTDAGDSDPGLPNAAGSSEYQVADKPSHEGRAEVHRAPAPGPASRRSDTDESPSPPEEEKTPGAMVIGWLGIALDVINLPFGRLGQKTQRVIGWCALALLVPALILLVVAFLS